MKLLRIVFILTLISFLATNFPMGNLAVYSRFVTLTLLIAGCLATVARLRTQMVSPVLVCLYIFLTYSFVTTFWTENLVLSLAKWVLYASLALALFLTGATIGQSGGSENPFEPLKWAVIPMVLTSLLALATGRGWVEGNFRAYSGNSNALGASLMLTAPWLIYELKLLPRSSAWHRRWIYFLCGGLVLVMLETHSRAALVALLLQGLIASRYVSSTRKMKLVYVTVTVLVLTYAVSGAGLFDRFYNTFVEKNRSAVFSSREDQMDHSWEAAQQGGMFGAGFGVSVGLSRYWEEGTTFSSASREKGNSTFAIMEETGIVGLLLYAGVLVALFAVLKRSCRTSDPDRRLIALIAIGYFCAALLHGQFEAWFLSFGPDVSVYWATLGLAIGALNRGGALAEKPVQASARVTAAQA
jgi:O-antigen ligase